MIEHDEWYQKYCELKDKQQEALKLWKKEKAEAKCQANKANKPVEVKHQSCSVLDRFVRKEEMEQKLSQWKASLRVQQMRIHCRFYLILGGQDDASPKAPPAGS